MHSLQQEQRQEIKIKNNYFEKRRFSLSTAHSDSTRLALATSNTLIDLSFLISCNAFETHCKDSLEVSSAFYQLARSVHSLYYQNKRDVIEQTTPASHHHWIFLDFTCTKFYCTLEQKLSFNSLAFQLKVVIRSNTWNGGIVTHVNIDKNLSKHYYGQLGQDIYLSQIHNACGNKYDNFHQ